MCITCVLHVYYMCINALVVGHYPTCVSITRSSDSHVISTNIGRQSNSVNCKENIYYVSRRHVCNFAKSIEYLTCYGIKILNVSGLVTKTF